MGPSAPGSSNCETPFDWEGRKKHAARIEDSAVALVQLVANYADPILREQYTRAIDDAEHAADRITHEVNRTLHKTFITPIDRDQIHSLINTMDDVADLIQDSAEAMARLERSLTRWGVYDRLREMAVEDGDTVRVGDLEFTFVE